MAVVAASGALVPANALWGPNASHPGLLVALGVATGVAGLIFAVLWLTTWPAWSVSVGFAFTTACPSPSVAGRVSTRRSA